MALPPLLLLLAILAVNFFCHSDSTTHSQDIQVLDLLKTAISRTSIPPASCIDSWDFSFDPCDRLFSDKFTCGFRCDVVSNSTSRITDLALDSAGYSANLSSLASFHLPFLQNLDFSGNNFYGSIPDSFSSLARLNRLALSGNSLSGAIPSSLGTLTALQELYIDGNALTGSIPISLNGLINLKRLELQGNNLSGSFPELTRLEALNFLDASDNAISGDIPAVLPPSLVELAMRNNRIEGNIPWSVVSSISLQVLDLSQNRLTGSVPAGLFTHPSLEQLTLSYNRFDSVQVPGNPVVNSQLISLDLSNNEIRGFLPGFMGLMPRLSALSLENNKLSGMIPTQLALKVMVPGLGVAQLERLLLGGNYLFGPIPGGFLELKAGTVTVRLGDNCLYRCPLRWFFCEGGAQKSLMECRAFGPIIP